MPRSDILPAASSAEQRRAAAALVTVLPAVDELGERFAAAGHALHLVGGSVRDALLGRPVSDVDLTTDARPEQVQALAAGWADAGWDVGIAFGTVGLRKGDLRLEVTTYRSEVYDRSSRNPVVSYGETLTDDLERRDFTVNALALSVPDHVLSDPFGGLRDLAARVLRTPGTPERSFDDDPLRILRAARFASQLGFAVAPEVVEAMRGRADRLAIVSTERVRDELVKLLLGAAPRAGLELAVDTGVADVVLPELPKLRLAVDEHHQHKDVYVHTLTVLDQSIALEPRLPGGGPDLVLRLAALLHDIGKPRTKRHEPRGRVSFHHHEVVGAKMARSRLKALKLPKTVISDVSLLVELHLRFHGYGSDADWSDAAVRRYVRDAGDQLERLHVLVRSDCTTRNRQKAARLRGAYDDLERRIARLREQEALDALRPDLDGTQIMQLLGVGPGPVVGRARQHLLALRVEHGPLGEQRATEELRAWARETGLEIPAEGPDGSSTGPDAPG